MECGCVVGGVCMCMFVCIGAYVAVGEVSVTMHGLDVLGGHPYAVSGFIMWSGIARSVCSFFFWVACSRYWCATSHTCSLLLNQSSKAGDSERLAFHGNRGGWYIQHTGLRLGAWLNDVESSGCTLQELGPSPPGCYHIMLIGASLFLNWPS